MTRTLLLLALALPSLAAAQVTRIVVPFAAGGAREVLARTFYSELGAALGETMIIDNRPGAGSSIAADAVVNAPADGNTLLLSTTANVINTSLYVNLRFNFTKDLTPVMLVAEAPAVLIARPNLPQRSVP